MINNDIDSSSLGGKKHSRSVAVPSSPAKGDTWDEITSAGDWVCDWFWNGTYWLSKQLFLVSAYPQNASGADSNSTTATQTMASPQIGATRYNLFLVAFSAALFVNPTNNTTNYWTVTLDRRAANNVVTNLAAFNTQSDAGATRLNKIAAINSHINLSTVDVRLFRVTVQTTGTPSPIQHVSHLTYRWARG